MTPLHVRSRVATVVLAAAALLAACGRDDSRGADGAPRKAGEVASETRQGAKPAADAASSIARDRAIAAGVKTRLAQDSQLAALDIDVRSDEGYVVLRGIAPDTAVRSHAGELAHAMAGVVDVRNDLSVQVKAK